MMVAYRNIKGREGARHPLLAMLGAGAVVFTLFGAGAAPARAVENDGAPGGVAVLLRLATRPALALARRGADEICMSLALYHEARGEPLEGQVAVAATILNRVASRAYPNTVCGVVFENATWRNACQFSFACDGRSDMPGNARVFARTLRLANTILRVARSDAASIDDGAQAAIVRRVLQRFVLSTHYHRYDVSPGWSRRMRQIARIGNHVFFRSRRVLRFIPDAVRRETVRVLADHEPLKPDIGL